MKGERSSHSAKQTTPGGPLVETVSSCFLLAFSGEAARGASGLEARELEIVAYVVGIQAQDSFGFLCLFPFSLLRRRVEIAARQSKHLPSFNQKFLDVVVSMNLS